MRDAPDERPSRLRLLPETAMLAAMIPRVAGGLSALLLLLVASSAFGADQAALWWKGNLHTHSLWSDGDDYPEMIVEWYKTNGYHFLAISDHNTTQNSDRWISTVSNKGGASAFENYFARFGDRWVETRTGDHGREVRLKRFAEYRTLFEQPNRFMLFPSEEVTDRYKIFPIHINMTNLKEPLKPLGGDSVLEVMQRNVDALLEQKRRTGQPMFAHLNHPNFGWGVTAEDLARVRGERFFEVYNGHPTVHNEGDSIHIGTERIWDVALAMRLTSEHPEMLFGVGTDDAHHYHRLGPDMSNSGRGWVMVRSRSLTPEAIIAAMENGDFYASSGVTLRDVRPAKDSLAVEIEAEGGVDYVTRFAGTRRGFDQMPALSAEVGGEASPLDRRYSPRMGEVFAEVKGTRPSYRFKGDELYVRATVISTKVKANGTASEEKEMAWVQPVVVQER
jgi:hypothetical protein